MVGNVLYVVVKNAHDLHLTKLISGAKILIFTLIIGRGPVCEDLGKRIF